MWVGSRWARGEVLCVCCINGVAFGKYWATLGPGSGQTAPSYPAIVSLSSLLLADCRVTRTRPCRHPNLWILLPTRADMSALCMQAAHAAARVVVSPRCCAPKTQLACRAAEQFRCSAPVRRPAVSRAVRAQAQADAQAVYGSQWTTPADSYVTLVSAAYSACPTLHGPCMGRASPTGPSRWSAGRGPLL